ncbi:MAG: transposase [Caldilineaceae bacterium]
MPRTESGYRRRNTLRHEGHDYTKAGAYFVTICERFGRCIFGQVVDQEMILSPLGKVVEECLLEFAEQHPEIWIDVFVIMPNHLHILIWLKPKPEQIGDMLAKSKERKFGDAIPGSLSVLIGGYKNSVTQRAINQGLILKSTFWQKNFHDHIVRGGQDLERIRSYIATNPNRWFEDQLHPDAPPNPFNRTWPRKR